MKNQTQRRDAENAEEGSEGWFGVRVRAIAVDRGLSSRFRRVGGGLFCAACVVALCGVMSGCKVFKKNPPPPRAEALDPERYGASHGESAEARTGENGEFIALPGAEDHSSEWANAAPRGNPDTWRPEWWRDDSVKEAGRLNVFATGEGADLLIARRRAMEAARDRLKLDLAGTRVPDAPGVTGDSVRLSNGTYRAFVRLSVAVK